jgi:hypothetical protein
MGYDQVVRPCMPLRKSVPVGTPDEEELSQGVEEALQFSLRDPIAVYGNIAEHSSSVWPGGLRRLQN